MYDEIENLTKKIDFIHEFVCDTRALEMDFYEYWKKNKINGKPTFRCCHPTVDIILLEKIYENVVNRKSSLSCMMIVSSHTININFTRNQRKNHWKDFYFEKQPTEVGSIFLGKRIEPQKPKLLLFRHMCRP